MATLNKDIAIAAWDEGWLFADLTDTQKLVLHPQVVTMNKLCRLILEHPGIAMSDLAALSGIHKNTAAIYLRWMNKQGILLKKATGQGRKAYYASVAESSRMPGFNVPIPWHG